MSELFNSFCTIILREEKAPKGVVNVVKFHQQTWTMIIQDCSVIGILHLINAILWVKMISSGHLQMDLWT